MKTRTLAVLAALLCCCVAAFAAGIPQPVHLTEDSSALLPLGETWRDANPYRGADTKVQATAVEVGQRLYNQACSSCHGKDAEGDRAAAPDLRGIQAFCKRVIDPALRPRCDADGDAYFARSVLEGKTKVGVVHMPAWKGYLSQEQVWAIKTFVESRP